VVDVSRRFPPAPFIERLGLRVTDIGEGWVETEVTVEDWHLQQHGFVHAGVVGTLADHTAGGAASTVIPEGSSVLTAEYKLNLLRPATGPTLRCRGTVVSAGRRLLVAEADIHAGDRHVARYLGTMAVVDRPGGPPG
jgi:uncharacterized protein (TIGR00369 family)